MDYLVYIRRAHWNVSASANPYRAAPIWLCTVDFYDAIHPDVRKLRLSFPENTTASHRSCV